MFDNKRITKCSGGTAHRYNVCDVYVLAAAKFSTLIQIDEQSGDRKLRSLLIFRTMVFQLQVIHARAVCKLKDFLKSERVKKV